MTKLASPGAADASGKLPSAAQIFAYRKGFTAAWCGLMHEAYPTAAAAALAFTVDSSTARDWWHGRGAPSGFVVGMAFCLHPALAMRWLVPDWGGWSKRLIARLTSRAVAHG